MAGRARAGGAHAAVGRRGGGGKRCLPGARGSGDGSEARRAGAGHCVADGRRGTNHHKGTHLVSLRGRRANVRKRQRAAGGFRDRGERCAQRRAGHAPFGRRSPPCFFQGRRESPLGDRKRRADVHDAPARASVARGEAARDGAGRRPGDEALGRVPGPVDVRLLLPVAVCQLRLRPPLERGGAVCAAVRVGPALFDGRVQRVRSRSGRAPVPPGHQGSERVPELRHVPEGWRTYADGGETRRGLQGFEKRGVRCCRRRRRDNAALPVAR
mmetsp:Transcript_29286/g.67080  ORF Transcript_29286/g.67080 Transcript_29286/m.67080 type:complete len:270 (+) Transcript_29286:124-933(+)